MKKWIILLLTVLMIAAFALPVSADNEETVLYEYDPATASQVWKSYTGNWTYDENGISVTNDGNDVWFYTYMGVTEGWTDYVIEVDLINVAEGGVIFRSTHPGPGVDAFGGYIIAYDSAYAYVGMDDNDCWKTLPDDGPNAPAATAMGYASEMHWKIVVQGNSMTLYVDNSPIPAVQVLDATYTEGGIGLRSKVFEGDESGYFANLKVYEIPEGTEVTEPAVTLPQVAEPTQPSVQEPTQESTQEPTQGPAPAPGSVLDIDGAIWIAAAVVVAAVAVVVVVIIIKKKK